MKKKQPYRLGMQGLCLIVFFRLVLLMYLYSRITGAYRFPVIKVFNWLEIGMLLVVIIEAFIYGWLRNRVQTKLWVRLHIWCLAVELILLPVIAMGLVFMVPQYFNLAETASIMKVVRRLRFYIVWLLMLAGHAAFIIVLVKSLKRKPVGPAAEEPAGILDEFSAE